MRRIVSRFTVYFEGTFWVGMYERESDGWYEACKITFGAEPHDNEVYALLLREWRRLRFSPPVEADRAGEKQLNPKRVQREARRLLMQHGVGTKAQQAISAAREQNKTERRTRTKAEKGQQAAERFARHQQKRKEKHKGH